MSQLSKQQLKVENNTEFPNNNSGQITPTRLRTFNEDMIDSTVNQTSFDSFSGSVASEINALEAFSSSLSTAFVSTASFNAYTHSTDSSISQLNASSASQQISIDALNVFTASQSTASIVTSINNLNSFTQSAGVSLTNLNSATASLFTSASLSLTTASFDNGNRNLTFSKGDGTTFAVNIPDVSGSTFNTGSFATTGSNTFNGDQTITGSLNVSASAYQATINLKTQGTFFGGPTFQLGGNLEAATFSNLNDFLVTFGGDAKFFGDSVLIQGDDARLILNDTSVPSYPSYAVRSKSEQLQFVDALNDGVMVSVTTASMNITGSLTASLQNGYTWVGDASGRTTTVATSSFGGGTTYTNPTLNPYSGSLILAANTTSTASLAPYITASNNGQVNLMFLNRNLSGGVYISGSSNIFPNPNSPAAGRLNYLGGSSNILLTSFTANNTQTFPTMTSSVATIGGVYPAMNANIVMGQAGWGLNLSNNPGIHNYNNNILNGNTTFNMVGNVQTAGVANSGRFDFTGNTSAGTIIINSPSRSVAEINAGATGSFRISMTNNTVAGTLTYNGPVSGSAIGTHTITTNVLAGTLTLNLQSQSRAFTATQNAINGVLTYTDNTVFAPTLGSTATLSNNSINGTLTITNRASASVGMSNSSVNGAGHAINNDTDASAITTAGQRQASVSNSTIGGFANTIYFTGSATGETTRVVTNSIIVGAQLSASVIGSSSGAILGSTAIFGHGLNVIGTGFNNAAATQGGGNVGSLFGGRWNAEDGNRALSSQTVFAIGTGNSGSAGITRKTGFLIDSGSNTFVEGTLNVSGSSTLSGSLYIQSGSTLPVSTGSAILTWDATTGQVKQASYSTIISSSVSSAEFWSTTTQSGSAGVSGSITFNNSGSFYNVSLVNGTRLTVANGGVYNIQFSAQIETSAGADTLWMWFKKNGTNIGDSASKAVLANNTAQIMTVNILDQANANDYYEIAYQTLNGNATVLAEAASGNIPAIPSVIATVFQIR